MLGGLYLACELANGVLYMLERVFKLAIRHDDVLIVGSNIHKNFDYQHFAILQGCIEHREIPRTVVRWNENHE